MSTADQKERERLEQWLGGRRSCTVNLRGEPCLLRVIPAAEVLSARREAAGLAEGAEEGPLCANACLLARALEVDGERLFPSGEAVLEQLTAGEIEALTNRLARLNREVNPSAEEPWEASEARKKALSTRPMSG